MVNKHLMASSLTVYLLIFAHFSIAAVASGQLKHKNADACGHLKHKKRLCCGFWWETEAALREWASVASNYFHEEGTQPLSG